MNNFIELNLPDNSNFNEFIECIENNEKYKNYKSQDIYIWILQYNHNELFNYLNENDNTLKFFNILFHLYSIDIKKYENDFVWVLIIKLILEGIINDGKNMGLLKKIDLNKYVEITNTKYQVFFEETVKLFSKYCLFNGFKYFYDICSKNMKQHLEIIFHDIIVINSPFNSDLRVYKFALNLNNINDNIIFTNKDVIFRHLIIADHIDFKYKVKRLRLLNEFVSLQLINFDIYTLTSKLNFNQIVKILNMMLNYHDILNTNYINSIISKLEETNNFESSSLSLLSITNLNIYNKINIALMLIKNFINPSINFNLLINVKQLKNIIQCDIGNNILNIIKINEIMTDYIFNIGLIYEEKKKYIYNDNMKKHYLFMVNLIKNISKFYNLIKYEPNNFFLMPFFIYNNNYKIIKRFIKMCKIKQDKYNLLVKQSKFYPIVNELNNSDYYQKLYNQSYYKNLTKSYLDIDNFDNKYFRYNINGHKYNGYLKQLKNNCKIIYNHENKLYQIYDINFNIELKDRYEFLLNISQKQSIINKSHNINELINVIENYKNNIITFNNINIYISPLIKINKELLYQISNNKVFKKSSIIDINNNIEYII